MLADVDDRVGPPDVAQPAIQSVVMVRRRQVGLMVDGVGVHAVAARRLQGHEHVAQFQAGQRNGDRRERTPRRAAVPIGRSSGLSLRIGQLGEPTPVFGRLALGRRWRVARSSETSRRTSNGRSALWISASPSAGHIVDVIAGCLQCGENVDQRGRRIEAHGVADPWPLCRASW